MLLKKYGHRTYHAVSQPQYVLPHLRKKIANNLFIY